MYKFMFLLLLAIVCGILKVTTTPTFTSASIQLLLALLLGVPLSFVVTEYLSDSLADVLK